MKQKENNLKLGLFVIAGLLAIMAALYIIAKSKNSFGSGLAVKIHFSNLNGLMEGNNVLYAGMEAGNVSNITILNDTIIEVKLLINEKISPFIHENAIATIGSEGLMGNKIVNLTPTAGVSPLIRENDLLNNRESAGIDHMMQKISKVSDDIGVISETMRNTILALDTGSLMRLLKSHKTAAHLQNALANLDYTSKNALAVTTGIKNIVTDTRKGKGTLGKILADSAFGDQLDRTMQNFVRTSDNARKVFEKLNGLADNLNNQLASGKGPVSVLLTDTASANNLKATMLNIKNGTDGFNQNMEALKHNFLLRGYFKRQEKEAAKRKVNGDQK